MRMQGSGDPDGRWAVGAFGGGREAGRRVDEMLVAGRRDQESRSGVRWPVGTRRGCTAVLGMLGEHDAGAAVTGRARLRLLATKFYSLS